MNIKKDMGNYGNRMRKLYIIGVSKTGGWPGFDINASVSELFTETNILALQILNNYIENNIEDNDIKAFFKFIFTEILFR